jgi:hypothetical protein
MSKQVLFAIAAVATILIAATLPKRTPPRTIVNSDEVLGPENPHEDEIIGGCFTGLTDPQPMLVDVKPIAPFVLEGIEWLADAQLENGGWGAGQHSRQDIRDPHAVQMDPATTAFAAMALLRSGNTLKSGPYSKNLQKALDAILHMVETAPNGPNITSITGTQPQSKLGQNIDVAMASQFLTKIKSTVEDENVKERIDGAIEVCVKKLELGQNTDGSYAAGGWAPVLQSAMATNALEAASVSGYKVTKAKLDNAKAYQRTNVDAASGSVRGEDAAGISLYALASTQRSSAQEARRVKDELSDVKISWEEIDADQLETELEKKGVSREEAGMLADAYVVNRSANKQLQNDDVLTGFGNNGGEEFLSYMMTSESMVGAGSEEWNQWHSKMTNLLSSVQNQNGSWSGHHCITSPVFCTAAVILAMTADRDAQLTMKK